MATHELKIPTRQGLIVAALLNEPALQVTKQKPMVILLHGTTGWKEEAHLTTLAKQLSEAGIVAVRFDAPGSGESEGTWTDDYRLTTYIQAVDDVYDYMIENYSIDQSSVGIWGHSAGGQVAAWVGANHPERFSAFCGSQISPGKMSSMFTNGGSAPDGSIEIETEIFGMVTLPKAYFEDRAQYVTNEATRQFSIPQLYIAGTKDDTVPAHSVKDTFEHANEPKAYCEFATDHMYKNDPENLLAINEHTTVFFKEYLI